MSVLWIFLTTVHPIPSLPPGEVRMRSRGTLCLCEVAWLSAPPESSDSGGRATSSVD